MQALSVGMIDAAKGSVTLAIGLIGVMALFLGLVKVAEVGTRGSAGGTRGYDWGAGR